jgi:hypothetical protein
MAMLRSAGSGKSGKKKSIQTCTCAACEIEQGSGLIPIPLYGDLIQIYHQSRFHEFIFHQLQLCIKLFKVAQSKWRD